MSMLKVGAERAELELMHLVHTRPPLLLTHISRPHLPRSAVSLFKVDVERAELAVLRGVVQGDWPKVSQVALEAHNGGGGSGGDGGDAKGSCELGAGPDSQSGGDGGGGGGGGSGHAGVPGSGEGLAAIQQVLASAGFEGLVVDQGGALAGTTLLNVYGSKRRM